MKAPIKERIVVLRYARIDDEVYSRVLDDLLPFLEKAYASDPFTAERINIPSVTMPGITFGDSEPDWKQVRIAVDRACRFWNESHTRCIQFYKDYLTVNLIVSPGDKTSGSHTELFDFFLGFLPFVSAHSKAFSLVSSGIDYLNSLSQVQLSQFLTHDGRTLELARLFNGVVMGSAISGAMFLTPFSHQTVYGSDPDSADHFPAQLTVSLNVPPHDPVTGWRVDVTFSAVGLLSDFSRDSVLPFLESMHEAVYRGYRATFSDEIIKMSAEDVS